MSSTPARSAGWLATQPTVRPATRAKPTTMLRAIFGMHLHAAVRIDHRVHHLPDVVGLVGVLGNDGVQRGPRFIAGRVRQHRWLLFAVAGHVADQLAQLLDGLHFVRRGEVRHAALAGMGAGTAEVLAAHLFVRHGLHHVGAGDEHVAGAFDHQHEIGEGRTVHRTAGTGPEDGTDLRHHAARTHVAVEDVGIAAEAHHPFLDARTTTVVEADDRCAVLHGEVHDAADLLPHGPRPASRRAR